MKYPISAWAALLASAIVARGEAPILHATDFFNQPGEYYRAYNNSYDALTQSGVVDVTGRIKDPGPDQYWDFSFGPTEVTNRYDYLDATGVTYASDFPGATIAERKVIEGAGDAEYLFFDQPEGMGRTVYGFYSDALSPETPSVVLEPAIEDFKSTVYYGQTWENSYSYSYLYYYTDPDPVDPTAGSFPTRVEVVSRFSADAYGKAWLPGLGLIDVLRVHEIKTEDVWWDFALLPDDPPQWTHAATIRTRVYRWLSPGKGIVVQIASEGSLNAEPPEKFAFALLFERMLETNKKSVPVDTTPKAVEGLGVFPSNGGTIIHWQAAANASAYRVEYSTGGLGPGDWQVLVDRTTDLSAPDPAGVNGQMRFYRVVSLR